MAVQSHLNRIKMNGGKLMEFKSFTKKRSMDLCENCLLFTTIVAPLTFKIVPVGMSKYIYDIIF